MVWKAYTDIGLLPKLNGEACVQSLQSEGSIGMEELHILVHHLTHLNVDTGGFT